MKINMHKRLKIILLIMNLVVLLATSVFLYREYTIPQYTEEKASLYTYNNKAGINYNVFLRPNVLYEEESLGEGQTYITEFIDHIQASFYYDFSGEREADVKGSYEILAEIEAYSGQAETYKTIWKKGYILSPKKDFQDRNKAASIKKDITLDIHAYNDFAKSVIEASKISSSVKLTAFMNVHVEANTDKGAVSEQLSSNMVIPLNTNHFEISGNLVNEKPGSIQETIQVQLPVDKKRVTLYGGIIGLLFILLILLSFFTKGAEKKSSLEKKLKQIFKKHGDRLVALNSEVTVGTGYYSEVKSIEGLVRIADELGKPIMYKYSSNLEEISKFYVLDEDKVFLLDMYNIVEKLELNSIKTKKELGDNESKLRAAAPENNVQLRENEIKRSDNLS